MATEKINLWFRTKAKVIFIVVCVVIMTVWLVPMNKLLEQGGESRGSIYGEKVPTDKVNALAHVILSRMERGDRDSAAMAYAQAYAFLILAKEAERYGVITTNADLRKALRDFFGMAQGGEVNKDAYAGYLAELGMTAPQFEEALRTMITGEQLMGVIQSSSVLTEDEAWLWFANDQQKIKTAYLQIKAADLAPLVEVTDAALLDFYKFHAERDPQTSDDGVGYQQPERVKIEYALLPYSAFLEQVAVTDDKVKEYYEAHKAEYELAKAPDAPADAPAAYSPIEDVADAIKKNLRMEGAKELAAKKMNDVKLELARLQDVPFGSNEIKQVNLAEVAKKFDMEYKLTDLFTKDQVGAVLPGAQELITRAFGQGAAATMVPKGPLSADSGTFVFQIVEQKPPQPAPFEVVKAQVEKDCRQALAMDLAISLAEKASQAADMDAAAESVKAALAELIAKAPVVEGAEPLKAEALFTRGESAFFGRSGSIPGLRYHLSTGLPGGANYADYADTAFALKEAEIGWAPIPAVKSVFLLTRIGLEAAARADFDTQKDSIMSEYQNMKAEAERDTWLVEVLRRARPSDEVMEYIRLLPQWSESLG